MSDAGEQASQAQQIISAVARVHAAGAVAALITVVDAPRAVGHKLLIEQTGASTGTTGDAALDDALSAHALTFLNSRAEAQTFKVEEFAPALDRWRGARVLCERIEPEAHVVVCGAGHVGAALARLAGGIGYRVTLIDDRADFVTRARFPAAEIELVAAHDGWAAAVRKVVGAGRGVYVAVVTRGHNEDEECMRAVLAARPDYVGMIGSKRRTNIVLARLRATGCDEETLREVRAPVGLDIGAVAPEEVALAILAEIVATRRGGTGTSLSAWRRKNKSSDE
jgi:xanthine dehydrogenase accessory factor